MKTQKLFTFIILTLTVASCVLAQKYMTLEELKNMNKKNKPAKVEKIEEPKVMPAPTRPGMTVKLKDGETLAEGSYSKIEKPFIYIARTKEDYAKIKGLVEGFSTDKEIDFNKQAVVAAFGGMKSTGGYSVQIYNLQGRTNILLKSPPKDAMVTQAITYPYKIAVVDVEEQNSLNVAFSDEFKSTVKKYTVDEGQFEFEGGFAGMETKFNVEGTIGVMKSKGFITFIFNLTGTGKDSGRKLIEVVSGKIDRDGDSISYKANISRLEAGNFIDKPHPPLIVTAEFVTANLSMKFEPGKRDYIVNDGFNGQGSLIAGAANAGFSQ